MSYPHFKIGDFVNKKVEFSGIDHPDRVVLHNRKNPFLNPFKIDRLDHFNNYTHDVDYTFNNRGFRDTEWPQDLINTPVIFGDSFVVGLGQPVEHRLSNLLGAVNISMDGASNDWIARWACNYFHEVKPKRAAVQWSYIQRREANNVIELGDIKARIPNQEVQDIQEHIDNLIKNVIMVEQASAENSVNLVHTVIPGYSGEIVIGDYETLEQLKPHARKLVEFHSMLDYSRDAHHYDIITATRYKDEIEKQWQN